MVNALDGAIAFFSPSWAAKRAQARADIERASMLLENARAFKAVSKGRRAGGDWTRVGASGPTDNTGDLAELSKRARIAFQNNPYWVSARRAIKGLVVGHGIRCSIGCENERVRKKIQDEWDTWASSTKVDVAGKLNLYGLQNLAMGAVADDGEALAVKRLLVTRDGPKLQIQMLSSEHLAVEKDGDVEGGGQIIGGVESDSFGCPVAYHIYDRHPSTGRAKVIRFDAADVIHSYRVDRAGQQRGTSWIAPVFTRLADWDAYEDADLMRMKVAACFAVIMKGLSPSTNYEVPERLQPGAVENIPAGTDVVPIAPPPSLGLKDAALIVHRAIATGLGITYEALTGDYSQVNFASGRLAHLQQSISVREWQRDIMISAFCERVFEWFMQARRLQRGAVIPASPVWSTWTAQSALMVDLKTEIAANKDRVRSGFASLSEVIRESGRDPEEVLTQLAADQKRCDVLGLTLDVDARKVSVQGQGSINQQDEGGSDGGKEKTA